MYIQQNEEQE